MLLMSVLLHVFVHCIMYVMLLLHLYRVYVISVLTRGAKLNTKATMILPVLVISSAPSVGQLQASAWLIKNMLHGQCHVSSVNFDVCFQVIAL